MQPFLASEYTPAPAEGAAFHIIPVPLERSVCYGGGTAQGPKAILEASQQLEALETDLAPGEGGFYTAPAVDCSGTTLETLDRIAGAAGSAISAGAIPVLLGGEHTVTLGALMALKRHADATGLPFGIVQFDAHADLRHSLGGDEYSHASVMRRAVEDLGLPLVQFAVRELSREEVEVRKTWGVTHYDAYFLSRVGLPEQPLPEGFPRRIYISFDVDGFDPSLMPATGTPSPGGLSWKECHFILERCASGHEIIGMDIVELAPIKGLHHADYTAARLAHLMMGLAWAERMRGTEQA